ncbi:alpha/beta fold hydrolase [Mycetocola lacteus]|uniref:Alpha/beta fold hydrolase n=2 Tax=Mycetocola lacteus TaxID=76637 RepID=A0A3L7ASV6_9MICO|nr:alpha/beta fold hydrolase [Mycetocola lacteus]
MCVSLVEVRAGVMLPAIREDITLHTEDGLDLVGELALPAEHPPVATLVTLHPLPTAQGFMDSHILRKAAARLPALADLAVLRFNTRGTSSPRGTSDGHFEEGLGERLDVAAAMAFVAERNLPNPWLVGWSFGTELALKYGREHAIRGAILLSPPLHRASAAEVAAWHGDPRELTALIPEHDDYLQPPEAVERFASVPEMRVLPIEGAKHLWVGEKYVKIVLDEIVRVTNPDALPLPTEWDEAE